MYNTVFPHRNKLHVVSGQVWPKQNTSAKPKPAIIYNFEIGSSNQIQTSEQIQTVWH